MNDSVRIYEDTEGVLTLCIYAEDEHHACIFAHTNYEDEQGSLIEDIQTIFSDQEGFLVAADYAYCNHDYYTEVAQKFSDDNSDSWTLIGFGHLQEGNLDLRLLFNQMGPSARREFLGHWAEKQK